jgi:hypothetical protein
MFNTTTAKKIYVPIELNDAETYIGDTNTRGDRFMGSFRQFVRHDGATNEHTKPACLDDVVEVVDEPLAGNEAIRSIKSPTLEDIIAKTQSK